MTVIVNGREVEMPPGATVADLLAKMGIAGRPVAVERNREVLARDRMQTTVLNDRDRLEVVTLVGGG